MLVDTVLSCCSLDTATLQRRPWQASLDNPTRGVVVWPDKEVMETTVTLYKVRNPSFSLPYTYFAECVYTHTPLPHSSSLSCHLYRITCADNIETTFPAQKVLRTQSAGVLLKSRKSAIFNCKSVHCVR
jgi:hypothetical protein